MPATVTDRLFGLTTSVAVKAPCRTVATSNITLSGLQTVNGVTVIEGDRVLVTAQSIAADNGIYLASSGAWGRSPDFDGARDAVQGTQIPIVRNGAQTVLYEVATEDPFTIGTSSIAFTARYNANLQYDITSGEVSAGVTPVDSSYPPGHVYRYGTNVTPGTTDMTTAVRNAALSSLYPYAPGDTIKVTGSTPLRADQQWHLDDPAFAITGNTQVFTVAAGIDDWSIRGQWSVIGDNNNAGSLSGTGAALVIIDSLRWYVDGPLCKNIKGWGVLAQPGSSTTPRAEHGVIHCPRAFGCYVGLEIQAGTGAEYIQVNSPYISRCATATRIAAGNANITGGVIVDNVDGFDLQSGANHAHGIVSGVAINHNSGFDFKADTVTNGQTMVGCHLYGNAIYFKSSQGVIFEACFIDMDTYYFEGSQGCGFRNCLLPMGAANTVSNDFGAAASIGVWDNCKKLTGKNFGDNVGNVVGVLVQGTSAGIAYTPTQLTNQTTILFTDAANWSANNTTQVLFDGYSAATGKFTCKGLGTGKVRVSAQINLTSNAADDTDSVFVFIRKNGTGTLRWLSRMKLSTTKTIFAFDGTVDLADTETIEFVIGQTSGIANNVTVASTETNVIVEGL